MGRSLESLRTCFLDRPEVRHARRILVFGEGDGRFLRDALRRMPGATFTVVESSPGMVAVARERLGAGMEGRVDFECVDARDFDDEGRVFDGVVMHCFLDCFSERTLEENLPRWVRSVPVGGWAWIGDYVEPSAPGWRWLQLRILYGIFRTVAGIEARRVHDPAPLLRSTGFELGHTRAFHFGACESRLFLRKSTG